MTTDHEGAEWIFDAYNRFEFMCIFKIIYSTEHFAHAKCTSFSKAHGIYTAVGHRLNQSKFQRFEII